MRKFLSFVVVLFISLIPFGSVQAHSLEPVQAFPSEGEVVEQSPVQIRLVFEEEIAEDASTLQVFNEQGQQVNKTGGVDLYDPQHVNLISELPELPKGIYLVKWQVTLSDGDSSQGQYYFGVGTVSLPQMSEPVGIDEEPQSQPETASQQPPIGLLLAATALLSATGFAIYRIRSTAK